MEEIRKLINELGGESYKDKDTEQYSEEAVELLIKKIVVNSKDKNDIESNTLIYKTLADWSKVEDNRETIIRSPSNIIEKTTQLFNFLLPNGVESLNNGDISNEECELFIMTCRLLGNLTYENAPNREFIFDKQPTILKYIANFITQTKFSSLQRTSSATLANLSSETDFIQLEFFKLGVVSTLIDLICREDTKDEVNQMAIKAFNNLVDNEQAQVNIHFKEIHRLLIQLKKSLNKEGYYDNSFAHDLVSSLSTLSLNKDLQKEILKEGFLNDLIELIEESDVHREMINKLADDEIEKDKDISIAPVTSELIFKLADNDEYRQYFYNKDSPEASNNILDRMIKIMTSPPPTYKDGDSKAAMKALDVAKVLKNITKTIALCSLEDDVIDKFIKTPKIFVDLLNTEDTERIVNGEMIIGNLARSEPNCRLLNSYNVVEIIADIMKKFPNFQPIQHLGLSAIRNLTLPTINKGFVPSEALLEDVVFNLKVHNQVIQFAALSLVKNFIGADSSNFKLLIEFNDALQSLLNLANGRVPAGIDDTDEQPQLQLDDSKIQELEDKFEEKEQQLAKEESKPEPSTTTKPEEKKKDKDMRVVYEATRLVLRFLENPEISKQEEKMKHLANESVEPFFSLLQSPFPILQVEGAKGLSLIIKFDKELLLSRKNWIKEIIEVLNVSIIPFQQLARESTQGGSNDPNHQRLLAQIQSNCNFSNELHSVILSNILFNFSLDESIGKKLKDQGIIAELKALKSKQDVPQSLQNQIQKILMQLTI